jgi:hypothetical protein
LCHNSSLKVYIVHGIRPDGMNVSVFALMLLSSIALMGTIFYPNFNSMQTHAEDDCEDKAFKKYMKSGEEPYDKYLDSADDVPLPNDEDDVDEYLDDLEPLAEDYIDDLEPYAEKYIDDLGDCIN